MNVNDSRLLCLAALVLATGACGGKTPDAPISCAEPDYAGKATDEAWRALVDVNGKPLDSSGAVYLTAPTDGQEYTVGSAPPTWTWAEPVSSLAPPAAPRAASRSFLSELGEWLLPSARAHLPPYTGVIYWVEVFPPGGTCPVAQVLTSELTWQPDPATWNALGQRSEKSFTVQVTRAYLLENRVTEGPYRLDPPPTIHWRAP